MKASVQTRQANTAVAAFVDSSIKSISAKSRSKGKADAQAAKLGVLMAEVGEQIGVREADVAIGKAETIETVEALLRQMMANGLTCGTGVKGDKSVPDMLKAPNNNFPGELYTVFVDAINAPRIAADLPEVSKGVRDNYLSKMRTFVRARGAAPLDLYGNLAKAKAEATKSANAKTKVDVSSSDDESGEATPSAAVAHVESVKGVAPLLAFLSKWIAENPKKELADGSDLLHIIGAAEDLLSDAQDLFKAESQAKAKGRK